MIKLQGESPAGFLRNMQVSKQSVEDLKLSIFDEGEERPKAEIVLPAADLLKALAQLTGAPLTA
jgi:hypothetical protein